MSAARTVAVAGASTSDSPFSLNVGGRVVEILLKNGAKVEVLVREESAGKPKIAELKNIGAEIFVVDYSKPESLDKALTGVDIVVSALSGPGFAHQLPLAQAASRSGVKLFVPSEFGNNNADETPDSPLYGKLVLVGELKKLGLPYTLIVNGGYAEILSGFYAISNESVTVVGDGKAPASWTALGDLAAYVGYVLTHLSYDQLANTTLRVESARISANDVVADLQKKRPGIKVHHVSLEEAQEKWEKEGDFLSWLRRKFALGQGIVGDQADLSTSLYPDWQTKDVTAFLQ